MERSRQRDISKKGEKQGEKAREGERERDT